jgi:intracellular septation protein A
MLVFSVNSTGFFFFCWGQVNLLVKSIKNADAWVSPNSFKVPLKWTIS